MKKHIDYIEPFIPWLPMDGAPVNTFVLLTCKSGTLTTPWVYVVGQFTKGYHDRWDDEGNDALMDRGYTPVAWSPLPNPPHFK